MASESEFELDPEACGYVYTDGGKVCLSVAEMGVTVGGAMDPKSAYRLAALLIAAAHSLEPPAPDR